MTVFRWTSPSSMGKMAVGCALAACLTPMVWAGPYSPAAGQSGSTAIDMNDPAILDWADGYEHYLVGPHADVTWQTPGKALGHAIGDSFDIVSLGRGGQITLTFGTAIGNGTGADFAVFENGFSDTFLELAWVEVSDNGVDFVRFSNDSKTSGPVPAFGSVDPTNVTGLAGKYRQGYGTPFDLADVGLSFATHVRLIDILGDGNALDTSGDVIYDLYPTVGSAGFDLDAVGVLNQVPEPTSFVLLGLTGLAMLRRQRNLSNA